MQTTYAVSTSHGSYYVAAECEYEAGKFAVSRLSARYPGEHITILAINPAAH